MQLALLSASALIVLGTAALWALPKPAPRPVPVRVRARR
ncbi:hypothetical protein SAMN05878426_10564 [Phaeovulum vinaykumarii]|uniref:Uncharacterized protein n=1 Tax=Phaeovulum vinaykumarii TaxID=407234 RepID=A0A1N7M3C6_9RHOB|nr:hypothetical protein SAMN05421795_105138 [Phaeovulum vinaykumarii]SOC09099.1 hypothetical protein SAMN05878426_10564 [Phaeovulum vinaykumarii]